MSRIFVLVALSTVLLVGAAAIGSSADNTETSNPLQDDLLQIFATGLDLTALVPLVLIVGLIIATLGVFARV